MIGQLQNALRFHGEALQLRAQRQQMLAANIANADTPGYKAVDFDFSRALNEATSSSSVAPRTTAPGHMSSRHGATLGNMRPVEDEVVQPAQDGNTVDMDKERARFAENAVRYEATLKFLNGQIRTLLSAIQGQ